MPIYYPDILTEKTEAKKFSYTDKDTIIYNLGIGMGSDPMDEKELKFVYQKDLKIMPSAVTVLSTLPKVSNGLLENNGFFPPEGHTTDPGKRTSSLDYTKVLHGEQKIVLHKPLPTHGTFTSQTRYTGVFDKGPKGAVLLQEMVWTDAVGEKVATSTASIFARADGGFGGPSEGAPIPHTTPTHTPDASVDIPTRPDMPALYRLSGDLNPLHIEPKMAKHAGFDRPIMHGLCSYGITLRAVLKTFVDYDVDQILSHQTRWSSPIFPGEVVTVNMWRDGKEISFEANVKARNVSVIKNGLTVLR